MKVKICFVCVMIILCSSNPAGSVSFAPYVSVPVDWIHVVAIGDVTGDGRNDIVALPDYDDYDPMNEVYVFSQNDSGSLNSVVAYIVGKRKHLAIGDVNHDGRNDVVMTADSGISVMLQNGSGGLETPVNYASTNSSVVRIRDINGDGRLDVIALSGSSIYSTDGTSIDIFLQNESDYLNLQTTIDLPSGWASYSNMDTGDMNGDGYLDIVLLADGYQGEHTIVVVYQDASGSLETTNQFSTGTSFFGASMAVGDVDGDGRDDVVVTHGGNSPASKVVVLYQDSSGSLSPAMVYDSYDCPGAVLVTDINSDGKKDVVVLHDGWNAVGVYGQNQSGVLSSEQRSSIPYTTWYGNHALAVGDINNDGKNDIVVGYQTGLAILYQLDSLIASNAYPLLPGDSWTYRIESSSNTYTTAVAGGTYPVNGVETTLVQGSDGSQMYMTSDGSGIYEHREYAPAFNGNPAVTVTLSPAFAYSEAEMTIGQSVPSSGTATFDYGVYGVYYLNYTGSSTLQTIETVVVPFGTFQAGRLQTVLTCTGYIGSEYVSGSVTQTLWVAENIGVVKQIFGSNTYVLTDANFTPEAFNFPSRIGVDKGTVIVSDSIVVSGISAPAAISIAGGEYNIDGGGYTSSPGFVTNGQTVRVRLMSSSNPGVSTTAALNIGGTAASFTVTTTSSLILYADFGASGIWKYNGAWSSLAPENPEHLAVSGPTLYADLGSYGIWKQTVLTGLSLPLRTLNTS